MPQTRVNNKDIILILGYNYNLSPLYNNDSVVYDLPFVLPSISSTLTVISNDALPLSSSMGSIILFLSLTKYDGFSNLTVIAIQKMKRNYLNKVSSMKNIHLIMYVYMYHC